MGKFGPCPECGQVISRDLGRCPYCRTDLEPGGIAGLADDEASGQVTAHATLRRRNPMPSATPDMATALPPPPAPPAIQSDIYRPTRSLRLALQLMFAAWMILGGLTVAARFVEWRLVSQLIENPFSVSYEQAAAADDRALRLGIVGLVAYVVTGILFVVWLRRSYRNLLAFGISSTRFRDGWAIGAWFIPGLNLVRPKQIIDECWHESGTGRDQTIPYRYRHSERAPVLLHVWWGLMIGGRVFNTYFWAGSPGDPRTLRFATLWLSIGAVIEMANAVAAFWVVTLLTRRQAVRAQRLLLDAGPRRAARPAVAVLVAVLPLAGTAAALFPFAAWDQPPASVTVEGDQEGNTRRYDAYGVSFAYPADYVAAEGSGTGHGAPSYEEGMVALTPADFVRQDHFIVVEWLDGLTAADAVDGIDAVIDITSAAMPGIPLIHTSELTDLPFGSGTLAARRFSIETDAGALSGAVGFGLCPASDRLVGVRHVHDGLTHYATGLDDLEAILATLSC